MREAHLEILRCPQSGQRLRLANVQYDGDRIKEGLLMEPTSGRKFPIVNFIPRFVSANNYTASFGFEWNCHSRTQQDQYSGQDISRKRFEAETRWEKNMTGQYILEAGCGAGRFTGFAAESGATVVSFDFSSAIDANYRNHGFRENVLFVQADICAMPFEKNFFDKIFCLGVLQHTPDPKKSFFSLVEALRPGGKIVTDIYIKDIIHWLLHTKTYVRPLTARMDPEKLYRGVKTYIDFMWPVAKLIRKIPGKIGQAINWRLLVADFYRVIPNADDAMLKEWAYLDTFDMLSPRYDKPQTIATFRRWHEEAGLQEIDVRRGYNGIEGRGVKPCVGL